MDISKLLESEIILSRGFMLSTHELFGGSYLAIVRNFVHRHGPEFFELACKNVDLEGVDDPEKLHRLLEEWVEADDVQVEVDEDSVLIETTNCQHYVGKTYKDEIGLKEPLVCPVGIISIIFIRELLDREVPGGKKDPSNRESTGYCSINLETRPRSKD